LFFERVDVSFGPRTPFRSRCFPTHCSPYRRKCSDRLMRKSCAISARSVQNYSTTTPPCLNDIPIDIPRGLGWSCPGTLSAPVWGRRRNSAVSLRTELRVIQVRACVRRAFLARSRKRAQPFVAARRGGTGGCVPLGCTPSLEESCAAGQRLRRELVRPEGLSDEGGQADEIQSQACDWSQ
jgi:hypothetical protein